MNAVTTTARDLAARNYYAWQIEKRFKTFCKSPALFIRNSDITMERNRRIALYAVEKVAVIPSAIVSPEYFAIGVAVSLACATLGSICFELRYPALVEHKKDWKDYFEATAILNENASKWLLRVLVIKAISAIVFSSIWPAEMVWYNSLVGLTAGMMLGRVIGSRAELRRYVRCQDPILTEPLLPSENNV